ncbi:hypothetical protein PG994_005135 [Apiospora phragmitis]|uniref:Uncharacterized protein n=1 Tax=Apiospora phragmitis TaxID=2905665 RepID=A0ABR1VSJ2_9PEZI
MRPNATVTSPMDLREELMLGAEPMRRNRRGRNIVWKPIWRAETYCTSSISSGRTYVSELDLQRWPTLRPRTRQLRRRRRQGRRLLGRWNENGEANRRVTFHSITMFGGAIFGGSGKGDISDDEGYILVNVSIAFAVLTSVFLSLRFWAKTFTSQDVRPR